jgi:hypothetical protein
VGQGSGPVESIETYRKENDAGAADPGLNVSLCTLAMYNEYSYL